MESIKFLSWETMARLSREWKSRKGAKNMKAVATTSGDRIYISTEEPIGNNFIDEQLLYGGDIILENEMNMDLKNKNKTKK